MSWLGYALLVVVAYLLGAIPFGLIVGLRKGVDIRRVGSGNTGATNALRAIGWQASAIVLLLDLSKALLPVVVARLLTGDPLLESACGLAAVVGHNWSVYIGWKGGKGVSSSLGVMAILSPLATLLGAMVAVPLIAITRYVSLGSVVGAVAIPLLTIVLNSFVGPIPLPYITASLILGLIVLIQHRSNIQRLLAGKERKIGTRSENLESQPR